MKKIYLHNRQNRPPRLQKEILLLPPGRKIHPHCYPNLLRHYHVTMSLLVSLPSPHLHLRIFIGRSLTRPSCLKRRKSKSKNIENNGAAPPKKGLFGMFGGKKNKEQQYNLETAQPNGFYGQQPPQAHLAGQEGGYVKAWWGVWGRKVSNGKRRGKGSGLVENVELGVCYAFSVSFWFSWRLIVWHYEPCCEPFPLSVSCISKTSFVVLKRLFNLSNLACTLAFQTTTWYFHFRTRDEFSFS